MALYLYPQFVHRASPNRAFDDLFPPGTLSSRSGIYRCAGCGREAVHTHDKPLPSQNHHGHAQHPGKILWQ
jgi:hypothetical protein